MRARIALGLFLLAYPANGQQYLTLDCLFTRADVMRIEQGTIVETKRDYPENIAITFSGFDEEKRSATLIGNAGSDSVVYLPSDAKITLVQITPSRNVTVTTIVRAQSSQAYAAVHTRHVWVGAIGAISHMQGQCRAR